MFAVIADQQNSKTHPDAVGPALSRMFKLQEDGLISFALPPERTAGDEFQCLIAEPESLYTLVRLLEEDRQWHIGVGIGITEEPLPSSVREARGSALIRAREAVEAAKSAEPSVMLSGPDSDATLDAGAVLRLLCAITARRTAGGWAAVREVESILKEAGPMSSAARALGISAQALSQRLQAANWKLELQSLPTLIRLLGAADAVTLSTTPN